MRNFILFLILCFTLFAQQCFAQMDTTFNPAYKDSILNKFLNILPEAERDSFLLEFENQTPEQQKEFILFVDFMSSLPQSSKKELIANIDTNYNHISALKSFFNTLVPAGYEIYIEFQPANRFVKLDESIDIRVSKNDSQSEDTNFEKWNIELKSSELDSILALTPLTRAHLKQLKVYLDRANCISINNYFQEEIEIGFSRSGMGKYSYILFDKPLTAEEKEKYNDGCLYIYYKDNIVLEYGGGAIGSQCFPDRD